MAPNMANITPKRQLYSYSDALVGSPVSTIFTFIKFSEHRWLKELRNGKLLFRPLRYFESLDGKDLERADKSEGASLILQGEEYELSFGGVELGPLVGPVLMHHDDQLDRKYVFCLYALHPGFPPELKISSHEQLREFMKLDSRLKALGDGSLLLFKNANEFQRRVINAIQKSGMRLRWGRLNISILRKLIVLFHAIAVASQSRTNLTTSVSIVF